MIDFIEQQSLNIITDITNSIKLQSKLYQINYIYQLIQHNQYARQLNKSHCTSIIDQLQEYNILHSSCIDQICSTSTSNTSSSSSSRGSSSSRRRSNNDNNAVCHTCKQQYILYNQYIAYYQTVQLNQYNIIYLNAHYHTLHSLYSTIQSDIITQHQQCIIQYDQQFKHMKQLINSSPVSDISVPITCTCIQLIHSLLHQITSILYNTATCNNADTIYDDTVSLIDDSLCSICLTSECNTILLPCNHNTFCHDCIIKQRISSGIYIQCPLCRTYVCTSQRIQNTIGGTVP